MFDQDKLPEIIIKALNSREPKLIRDTPSHYKHAGVLIPLFVEEGMYKVLFTKRTDHVEHHKGQISFPGGAADPEDQSIEETVLRESYEEIGLAGKDVDILGRIDDTLTLESNFVVHPFVGLIQGPYEFAINKAEVKRIIKVPWDRLISANMENKKYSVNRGGVIYQTPAYEYNGDLIWGATAKIIQNFIDILSCK